MLFVFSWKSNVTAYGKSRLALEIPIFQSLLTFHCEADGKEETPKEKLQNRALFFKLQSKAADLPS